MNHLLFGTLRKQNKASDKYRKIKKVGIYIKVFKLVYFESSLYSFFILIYYIIDLDLVFV